MEELFTYRFDRRTLYFTAVYFVIFALLGWGLYRIYEGDYISAWFVSFVVALVALMALSIPRRIVVTEEAVEICCLLDITEIQRSEIVAVRRVEPRQMRRRMVPLFAGWGFFGYYGRFLDLRTLDRVQIYASEWRHFVEIVDVYEDHYFVSCREADRLVELLTPPEGNRSFGEEDEAAENS